MSYYKISSLLLVCLLLGVGIGVYYRELSPTDAVSEKIPQAVPTLFFHGWGSSAEAEHHMTSAIKKAGITDSIIQARVDKSGQVSLKGKISANAKHPLVEVEYVDNKNSDYQQDAQYAKAVVDTLQKVYGFHRMNMVAHSMGNMSVLFYLLNYGTDTSLPKLEKYVAIGSVVNGGLSFDYFPDLTLDIKTGQPSHMTTFYQDLLPLTDKLPKDQLSVLTIYGNYKNNRLFVNCSG